MDQPERPGERGILLLVATTIGFTTLHLLWYTRVVAWWLWEVSGGIVEDGRLTTYGTIEWAWTVPLHLPAGLAFHAGSCLGLPLLLGGTFVAGLAVASLVVAVFERDSPVPGRRWWRLWLILAGWGWVPVPSTMSWIYQWTVVY